MDLQSVDFTSGIVALDLSSRLGSFSCIFAPGGRCCYSQLVVEHHSQLPHLFNALHLLSAHVDTRRRLSGPGRVLLVLGVQSHELAFRRLNAISHLLP